MTVAIGTLVLVAVMTWIGYRAGLEKGSKPLTSLKPGREYLVEAVMATTIVGNNVAERLVVSWHCDYGHYEWRFVVLDRSRMEGPRPKVGDRLIVWPNKPDIYFVVAPGQQPTADVSKRTWHAAC